MRVVSVVQVVLVVLVNEMLKRMFSRGVAEVLAIDGHGVQRLDSSE